MAEYLFMVSLYSNENGEKKDFHWFWRKISSMKMYEWSICFNKGKYLSQSLIFGSTRVESQYKNLWQNLVATFCPLSPCEKGTKCGDQALSNFFVFWFYSNHQYDERLFIVLENCKLRIIAVHVVNTSCCFCFVLTFRTILVHKMFCRCCELLKKIYQYWKNFFIWKLGRKLQSKIGLYKLRR